MQRARQKRTFVSSRAQSLAPASGPPAGSVVELHDPPELPAVSKVTGAASSSARPQHTRGQLATAIRQRIETRLPGRLRGLVVRVSGDTVVLEGQCATYYTKQLAQHAALGVLDDEHLENSIVVNVPR